MEYPLVSVAVITYNSSKYILETLESIKEQTYSNIELIISDDCSMDSTINLCRTWIQKNKERFVRTEILTIEKNTGISANCNRAEAACKGEWVKLIAGDDILLPQCVACFMDYITVHQDALCVLGKMQVFGGDKQHCEHLQTIYSHRIDDMSSMSTEQQLEMVMDGITPPAPAIFKKRNIFEDYQIKNDERIPLIEDLPLWINLLQKGVHLHAIDQYVVKYRLGGISTSHEWKSMPLFRNQRQLFFYYIWNYFYNKDAELIIQKTVDFECDIYKNSLKLKEMYDVIASSIWNRILFKIMKMNYSIKKNLKK